MSIYNNIIYYYEQYESHKSYFYFFFHILHAGAAAKRQKKYYIENSIFKIYILYNYNIIILYNSTYIIYEYDYRTRYTYTYNNTSTYNIIRVHKQYIYIDSKTKNINKNNNNNNKTNTATHDKNKNNKNTTTRVYIICKIYTRNIIISWVNQNLYIYILTHEKTQNHHPHETPHHFTKKINKTLYTYIVQYILYDHIITIYILLLGDGLGTRDSSSSSGLLGTTWQTTPRSFLFFPLYVYYTMCGVGLHCSIQNTEVLCIILLQGKLIVL